MTTITGNLAGVHRLSAIGRAIVGAAAEPLAQATQVHPAPQQQALTDKVDPKAKASEVAAEVYAARRAARASRALAGQ